MNKNTIKLVKSAFCALVIAIVLAALLPVSVMADTVTVSITSSPDTMTPLVQQSVTVHVHVGGGTLADLTNVTFKTWWDDDLDSNGKEEFDDQTLDPRTCAEITWAPHDTFAMTPMGTTTWLLGTCTAPSPLSESDGDFIFVFTPGKVAEQASGIINWEIGATATTSGSPVFTSNTSRAGMNLYQEISISGSPVLSWGALSPGLGFYDSAPSMAALGQTVTIISNASYKLNAQSTTPWNGDTHTANLDVTGIDGTAQQFSLRVGNSTANASAQLIGSSATLMTAGNNTLEGGDTFTNIHVWLKLAGTFAPDLYNGTITFSVSQ